VTADEVAEQLATVPGLAWTPAAWRDFLACPPELQASLLAELRASATPPGADWAAGVLRVLKDVLLVAGAISGVTGAVSGIQGVKW